MTLRDMEDKSVNNKISSDVIAAYLDGNASSQEFDAVLNAIPNDAELRELLSISLEVDRELGCAGDVVEFIPMTAMAAMCDVDNFCCIECEKFILSRLNIDFDEQALLHEALRQGWQQASGTALYNIGRNLEQNGLVVTRRYKCTIRDIADAIVANECVIAVVDSTSLYAKQGCHASLPNHAVVVTACDETRETITIYDPNSLNVEECLPFERFVSAWEVSKHYLVTACRSEDKVYIPRSIDISDVTLNDDLQELCEAIAENAHEVWAENRYAEGWRYGLQRNDELKLHPDMVPYSQLPEGEKEYDREMAMKTIKLLVKLGYKISK